MIGDSIQLDMLEGKHITLGNFGNLLLQKRLGGGATAVVFRGVAPAAPEDPQSWVAVKVARPEKEWTEALVREWKNLTRLEAAEAVRGTHYFPRIKYPRMVEHLHLSDPEQVSERHLMHEQYVLIPGRGSQLMKWTCLVLEYVASPGIHDLLIDYPGVRLPEPLALAVAEQYAEMLTILHGAGIACADRKLADLRWKSNYKINYEDRTWLQDWYAGRRPGELIVLDWNVTQHATPDVIRSDLWRFGVLFAHMALAFRPTFRLDSAGQEVLEEPLEQQESWKTLTFGTQQIFYRLFHPLANKRYPDARSLLFDIEEQLKIWRTPAQWLLARAKEVSQLQEAGRLDTRPTAELVKDASFINVYKALVEKWREEKPIGVDFYRLEIGIDRVLTRKPFGEIAKQLILGQWYDAQEGLERLRKQSEAEPAKALWVERYHLILDGAMSGEKGPSLGDLLYVADVLYDPEPEPEEKARLAKLDEWEKQFPHGAWARIIQRLRLERDYYRLLQEFRQSKEDAERAREKIQALQACRQVLSEVQRKYLDLLYGNADEEIAEFDKGRARQEDFKRILGVFLQAISIQDWATAEKTLEDKRLEERYRSPLQQVISYLRKYEAVQQNSLAFAMQVLCDYRGLLQRLQRILAPSDLEKLENELNIRREQVRDRLISALVAALQPSILASAESEGWDYPDALSLLLRHYADSFPEDAEDFRNAVEKRVGFMEEEVKRYTAEAESDPRIVEELEKQVRTLERAYALARWGSAIWPVLRKQWETHSPDVIGDLLHDKREKHRQIQLLLREVFPHGRAS